jgi:heme exporter protein D
VTGGYITGGWSFVWSAYGLTAFALGAYAVSVIVRLRRESSR